MNSEQTAQAVQASGGKGRPPVLSREIVAATLLVASCLFSLVSLGHAAARLAGSTDYVSYYAAAVAASHHSNPYDFGVISRIEGALRHGSVRYPPYVGPPWLVPLISPLGLLSPRRSSLLFFMLLVTCQLLAGIVVGRLAGGNFKNPLVVLIVLAAALDYSAFRYAISLGQIDPIVGFLILLSVFLMARHREVLSGFVLASGFLKPQLILLPILVPIYARKWRLLQGLVAGFALLVLLALTSKTLGLETGSVSDWLQAGFQVRHGEFAEPAVEIFGRLAIGAIAIILTVSRYPARYSSTSATSFVFWFSASAVINAIVAPVLHFRLYSQVLSLLPLGLLAAQYVKGARARRLSLGEFATGVLAGLVSGGALLSVSHSAGLSHVLLAELITLLLFAGMALVYPPFARVALLAGLTNVVVSSLPLSPHWVELVGLTASIILLCMLWGNGDAILGTAISPGGRIQSLKVACRRQAPPPSGVALSKSGGKET